MSKDRKRDKKAHENDGLSVQHNTEHVENKTNNTSCYPDNIVHGISAKDSAAIASNVSAHSGSANGFEHSDKASNRK